MDVAPIDWCRDAAPIDLCRDAAPIDLYRDVAPIDLCRDAAPIDKCRNAAPIDLCRDAAPSDLYRDAASIDSGRAAAPTPGRTQRETRALRLVPARPGSPVDQRGGSAGASNFRFGIPWVFHAVPVQMRYTASIYFKP